MSFAESLPSAAERRFGETDVVEVSDALEAAQQYLLSIQESDGHWCAELEGDTILESEWALAMHFLGKTQDPRVGKAANYLRQKQLPEGGWTIYPGGPPDVSASVKAYFVLKLVGDDPQACHMRKARQVILRLGGLDACNSFTRIYLSIFGQYEWKKSPAVPPEIILLPRWFYFNIYEMSSWSRAIVVPLSIIWACKPFCPVPEHASIKELRAAETPPSPEGSLRRRIWRQLFLAVDWAHKLLESLSVTPLRQLAVRRAEAWIRERLEGSDGLGAIFPPIVNTIIAFRSLGYSQDEPVIQEQIGELEKLEIEEDDTLRLQPCLSPVWDTVLTMNSLAESGLAADHPDLLRAARWLLAKEVKRPGDWQIKSPQAPVAGWYFEYANEPFPDCDDTAEALVALNKVRFPDSREDQERKNAMQRGLQWQLAMQCSNGGWASFDKDCDKEVLTLIPFADHNAMIDPATVDITARTLEALGDLGFDRSDTAVARAIQFLRREQEADGSWYGRWGCNYIYGTWLALWGLKRVGEDLSAQPYQRSARWLKGCQNPDGGWGESLRSYDDPQHKGRGASTACQTAWALMGLLALGDSSSEAVRRGLEYLVRNQRPDGSWKDQEWTGTGFPRVFYLNYHLYATYFSLLTLSTYQRQLAQRNGITKAA